MPPDTIRNGKIDGIVGGKVNGRLLIVENMDFMSQRIRILITRHCKKMNKPRKQISPALMEQSMDRQWVGNIRELENVIVRGILFAQTDEIGPGDVQLPDGQTRTCVDVGTDLTAVT